MPQGAGAVYAAVAKALAAAGYSAAAAKAVAVVAAVAYTAASTYALNRVVSALTPKPQGGKGAGYNLNYSGTFEPRRIVYGEVVLGGMQTIPPICTGDAGKYLHMVLTVAGHEVEDITDVYFDAELIADAEIGAVSGTDADGVVAETNKFKHHAWIRRYLGTSTQTADYILTQAYPSAFDSNFRGRGVAYMALRLKFYDQMFSGVPSVTARVKGHKCYDPRSGLTVYTTNPALCAAHYLTTYVGVDSANIDWTSVTAAANVCDQLVDIPTSTTQKRYQCNVMLSDGAEINWEDNLRTIVDAMRGRYIQRDGVWYLYAGAWDVPAISIERKHWVGPTQVQASAPLEERWNRVTTWYVDAERRFQRVSSKPRRSSAYEAADGDLLPLDLELPAVTNEYEAQRHAEFCLRASRNQLRLRGKLKPEFARLATWETVSVTDEDWGFASKTFRVFAMDMDPQGNVDVVLAEEGSATWTDLAESDYNAPDSTTSIDPGYSVPEARTGFAATAFSGNLQFRWDVTTALMPNELTRLVEYANSGYAHLGTELWRGTGTGVNIPKTDATTRYYWIQGVVDSYLGAYTPNTFGLPAAANSGGAGAPGADAVTAFLTLPAVTLPASVNGTVADYNVAKGLFQVRKGDVDVSSWATFDTGSMVGCFSRINTADNSPWASNTRGTYNIYSVTSDVGIAHFTAVYSGVTYLRQFVAAKARVGSAGTPGQMGPPSGNMIANGYMTAVDSTTGRLSQWDGQSTSYAYNGTLGVDSTGCMVVSYSAGTVDIANQTPIAVNPYTDVLDVSLYLRSVNSGTDCLLYMECFDDRMRSLGQQHTQVRGWTSVYSAAPLGANTLAVFKPITQDFGWPGYVNSAQYVMLPGWGDNVAVDDVTMAQHFPRTGIPPVLFVNTVNTALSTSFDVVAVTPTLPNSLLQGRMLAFTQASSAHRYWPGGTTVRCSSAYTKVTATLAGLNAPIARLVGGGRDVEHGRFRQGTAYVRFGLVTNVGGTASAVLLDEYVAIKRTFIAGTLMLDPTMELGGGMFTWDNPSMRSNSACATNYAPSSGFDGGGALVLRTGSAGVNVIGGQWKQ